jgi:cystathionine beta-lyase
VESLTNPLLRVPDVRALARLAHANGALLSVDSTALSPYLQRPLELGADVVVHSATKYLCGHGDVVAGAVVLNDSKLADEIYAVQNGEGTGLGPFECFLLLRGMKTLAVRLDRQQTNARRVAEFLAGHPGVRGLRYPGLPSHPGHLRHLAQARGAGAVVSLETGSLEASRRLVESLRLFSTSVSFGGVGSAASLPCRMSHASIPEQVRRSRGLPEDLVRLSIGIEDADDLVEDLRRSLEPIARVGGSAPAA